MNKIKLIVVGKTREKYNQLAEQEFIKRLQRYTQFSVCVAREEKITPSKQEWQIQATESERIRQYTESNEYLMVLDKNGRQFSSEEFAAFIQALALKGQSKLCFIIGGPLGLPENFINEADLKLSFSKMTFTHEMMRTIFLEQLYRAFTILNHENYHK